MNPHPSPITKLLAQHTQMAHALAQATFAQSQREQVLLLLQADLRNYRLLYGLEQSGFISDYFHTHLEQVVLPMMGFSEETLLHDHRIVPFYFELLDRAMNLPLQDFLQQLPELAVEMYGELVLLRMEVVS